ncbi:hypothetical protein BKA83DRAFT_4248382 [Pisolithus microcarpus]|nr:hypothetical protein BKA83DRAFT_4248382 [Pisolithus microcarpus]
MVLTAFCAGPICHLAVLLIRCPLMSYRSFAAWQFLHSVDWVHHDVSACNVLRSGNIGKIDGLECAKHMDYKTTHKVATVCEFFVRGTC